MNKECQKSILIIEDSKLNMKLVVDLLGLEGFNILQAADGEAALEILKKTMPDLILMDIQLPGIDGIETFKKIRENKRFDPVKLVALTAQVMKEDLEQIRNVRFDAYISKPIDTKRFVTKIRTMLL